MNRGIRWRIPELKAHDLYVKEYEKRKQLFNGLLEYYCKDNRTTNDQILQFDECFNIAFNVDPDVTAFCRKKIFMFPGDVKEADCSDDDTREGEEVRILPIVSSKISLLFQFRACVTHKMMEKNPKFDLYDHAKTSKEKDNVELSKWLKKRSLKCLRRVFHMYLEDLQSEHDWPIWGNKFYYE